MEEFKTTANANDVAPTPRTPAQTSNILSLKFWPDPWLRLRTKQVEPYELGTSKLKVLVDDMKATLVHYKAVGLAAPQIGINKSLLVYLRSNGLLTCLINPTIIEKSDKLQLKEGCLSFPGVSVDTERAKQIVVTYLDLEGKQITDHLEDIDAVCIQHETDHLLGQTFLSFLSRMKQDIVSRKVQKFVRSMKREQSSR